MVVQAYDWGMGPFKARVSVLADLGLKELVARPIDSLESEVLPEGKRQLKMLTNEVNRVNSVLELPYCHNLVSIGLNEIT